ncbi:MAG: DUF503 family protein [Clostridium paraputrificum]
MEIKIRVSWVQSLKEKRMIVNSITQSNTINYHTLFL